MEAFYLIIAGLSATEVAARNAKLAKSLRSYVGLSLVGVSLSTRRKPNIPRTLDYFGAKGYANEVQFNLRKLLNPHS